jgi:hypothetical protein
LILLSGLNSFKTLGAAANTDLGAAAATIPILTAGQNVVTTDTASATDVSNVVIPLLLTSGEALTNTTTINSNTVYVKDAAGNKVNATIDFVGPNHQPVIKVADKLAYNAKYTVVADGVKEVSGNTLSKVTFDFTTKQDTTHYAYFDQSNSTSVGWRYC